ncbi:MAG: polysaccharide pyruvyl transferase family protein [Candidatus Ventricola sp.]
MKIKTITCHDVYNVGASLQAYALEQYLTEQGHDVEIIDYKPDYLSRHYSLSVVSNPRFDRPLVRQAYLLAKLPGRLKARFGGRKRNFDLFKQSMLHVTAKRYDSAAALRADPPEADAYIAGSDQIWNPLFPNGKDEAFFLAFVPDGRKRISYAASFAVEALSGENRTRMKPWLEKLDAVSVREASGVRLLESMGLQGVQVCDPVFLLTREQWAALAVQQSGGVLVYDFDSSEQVQRMADALSESLSKPIVSVFPMPHAAQVCRDMGPREFLGAVASADVVLSNSFHATAFALLFHKDFFVVERREKINTRMRDLLASVGLPNRMIRSAEEIADAEPIDWEQVDYRLLRIVEHSSAFLRNSLSEEN